MGTSKAEVAIPHSEQWNLQNKNGELYRVQISWPLHWHEGDEREAPLIYIVDGNALFMTATEAAWRRATGPHYAGGGIVVAIGYPLEGKVYDKSRRAFDLTPSVPDSTSEFGGADGFLRFISGEVRDRVKTRFPHLFVTREALFGHSYGGLFVLHALFTNSSLFDCYIASSPSFEWANHYIKIEEEEFRNRVSASKPSLMLFFGSLEQNPRQWNDETLEQFEKRRAISLARGIKDNAEGMCERLRGSSTLCAVTLQEYEGEDHGSVMACSMSRSLTSFFEEWPLQED